MLCGESSFQCYHGVVMRTWLKNVAMEKVENEKKLTKVKARGLETHCDGSRMYVCVCVFMSLSRYSICLLLGLVKLRPDPFLERFKQKFDRGTIVAHEKLYICTSQKKKLCIIGT